jgi:hypothetical protein
MARSGQRVIGCVLEQGGPMKGQKTAQQGLKLRDLGKLSVDEWRHP